MYAKENYMSGPELRPTFRRGASYFALLIAVSSGCYLVLMESIASIPFPFFLRIFMIKFGLLSDKRCDESVNARTINEQRSFWIPFWYVGEHTSNVLACKAFPRIPFMVIYQCNESHIQLYSQYIPTPDNAICGAVV